MYNVWCEMVFRKINKKLPRKVKYIKKCYFLSSLDALLPTKKYKDYKVNLKNALKGEAAIVLFTIN